MYAMDNEFGVYQKVGRIQLGGNVAKIEASSVVGEGMDSYARFSQNLKAENLDEAMNDVAKVMSECGDSALYACLRNMEPDQSIDQKYLTGINAFTREHQRDDGYGSQTISIAGAMDSACGNDLYPHTRERCHTWPSSQQAAAIDPSNQQFGDCNLKSHPYDPFIHTTLHSQGSTDLSLINESNESLSSPERATTRNPIKMDNRDEMECGQRQATAKANAGNSTAKTASRIGLSSRYSTGCDSAEPNGKGQQGASYKSGHPSYVELITQAIHSSPEKRMTLSEIYDWMVANVPAFKDQRYLHSSSGWKNSVRHNLSLHSRFKRVKRNGMDKPSWWTVDLTDEVKRERSSKRPSKQARPRANTTAGILHSIQHGKLARTDGPRASGPNTAVVSAPDQPGPAGQHSASLMDYHEGVKTSVEPVVDGIESMEWSQCRADTDNQPDSSTRLANVKCLSQAITVTLCDSQGDSGKTAGNADVAFTMVVANDPATDTRQPGATWSCENGRYMSTLVTALRRNTLEERQQQLLCVRNSAGRVQQIAVPAPVPIKVVLRSNKSCQTEQTMLAPSSIWQQGLPLSEAVSRFDHLVSDELVCSGQTITSTTMYPSQPDPLSPVAITNGYQQAAPRPQPGNAERLPTTVCSNPIVTSAPLPEDLASLDVRDGLDCNIMEILSYEMNCGSQANSNLSGFN